MARVINRHECPRCSGKDRNGKRVYLHASRMLDRAGNVTRIDEFCPRCLWMRVTDTATGATSEGRAHRQTRKAA